MTRPSLAGIEPLSATPWTSRVTGTSNGVRVYDGKGSPLPGCFSCGENDAVYEPEDGALIAAAPDLLAAVRDVLALHTDGGQSQGYTDDAPGGYGYIDHCCTECGSFGEYGEPWPCPTVRALAAHLDLTAPEGDPT